MRCINLVDSTMTKQDLYYLTCKTQGILFWDRNCYSENWLQSRFWLWILESWLQMIKRKKERIYKRWVCKWKEVTGTENKQNRSSSTKVCLNVRNVVVWRLVICNFRLREQMNQWQTLFFAMIVHTDINVELK
jgi:hypothetical protein